MALLSPRNLILSLSQNEFVSCLGLFGPGPAAWSRTEARCRRSCSRWRTPWRWSGRRCRWARRERWAPGFPGRSACQGSVRTASTGPGLDPGSGCRFRATSWNGPLSYKLVILVRGQQQLLRLRTFSDLHHPQSQHNFFCNKTLQNVQELRSTMVFISMQALKKLFSYCIRCL